MAAVASCHPLEFMATARSALKAPTTAATNPLATVIPGLDDTLATASGNIDELLSGNVSPSIARNASAYMGVASGMPGSEFVRNRGFDLYNTQGNAMKRQGLGDLLSLLQGVSGTVAPTTGQSLQNEQFNRGLDQSASQFGQTMGLQRDEFDLNKWLSEMNLGLAGQRNNIASGQAGNDMLSTYLSFLN